MSDYKSEYEEKLLEDLLDKYQPLGIVVWGEIEGATGTYAKILVKSDGTIKVEGVTTISGSVDVSDRWARQLGQVDIARYLGSAIGVANALHAQIVYGGAVIDPRDVSDRASRLLGIVYGSQNQQLLQRALTYESVVQLSHQGSEYDARQIRTISETITVQATDLDIRNLIKTQDEVYSVLRTDLGVAYDARDRSWNLGASDVPDLTDRAARLLGKVYGNQDVLQQRATTKELYVQISHQGLEKDPTQIRTLTTSDAIESYLASGNVTLADGISNTVLLTKDKTGTLLVSLRIFPMMFNGSSWDRIRGTTILGLLTDISDDATRLLGIIYGDQGQLAQRATTRDALVQLRVSGTEIDPRITTDVTKVVTPSYLAPTALAANGTATIVAAPGVGFKLRLKRLQVSVDAATRIDFRWATTAFESYYLPANGSVVINKIGENFEGGNNQALTLLSSAAATVTASASTETLAV